MELTDPQTISLAIAGDAIRRLEQMPIVDLFHLAIVDQRNELETALEHCPDLAVLVFADDDTWRESTGQPTNERR